MAKTVKRRRRRKLRGGSSALGLEALGISIPEGDEGFMEELGYMAGDHPNQAKYEAALAKQEEARAEARAEATTATAVAAAAEATRKLIQRGEDLGADHILEAARVSVFAAADEGRAQTSADLTTKAIAHAEVDYKEMMEYSDTIHAAMKYGTTPLHITRDEYAQTYFRHDIRRQIHDLVREHPIAQAEQKTNLEAHRTRQAEKNKKAGAMKERKIITQQILNEVHGSTPAEAEIIRLLREISAKLDKR